MIHEIMEAGPAIAEASSAAKSQPDQIIPPRLKKSKSQVVRAFLSFLSDLVLATSSANI
jgi:hypothetical protein